MWIVNGEEYNDVQKAATAVTDAMDDSYYAEMLDELYSTVSICGYEYSASHALKELDPIAYRCGMVDYYDSLECDIISELEDMEDGDDKMLFEQDIKFQSDKWDEMKSAVEELGWNVTYHADETENWVTFQNCSPLGEDLVYEASYDTIDDVEDSMTAALWDFDADEHVRELIRAGESGLSGVPHNVRALIEDAEEIGNMLDDLVETIREVLK